MDSDAAPPNRGFLIVYALIALSVGIEAVLVAGDLGVFDQPRFRQTVYEYGGFWAGLLADWRPNFAVQPYTMFLTYGFLHAGWVHLTVNMITLWGLGRLVAERVTATSFCLLYAVSIMGGAIGFAALSDSFRPMVGASGALFGLAGAFLVWEYLDRRREGEPLWPVWRACLVLGGLNVVMFFLFEGHLAWEAHLGGFLAGAAVAPFLKPRALPG